MRYRFIEAEKAVYPVEVLCRVPQAARSGLYAWCGRRQSARSRENLWLLTHIRACYRASPGRYGRPRIHHEFAPRGSASAPPIASRG